MGTAFAGAYDACVLAGLISLSKELENNFSLKKPDFCARINCYDEWKKSHA